MYSTTMWLLIFQRDFSNSMGKKVKHRLALVNPGWRRLPHWRTCAPSLCPHLAWPRSAPGPVCSAKALWPFWSISMGPSVAKGKGDKGMSFLAPFSCRIPGRPVLQCHSQTWIWQVWKYAFNWTTPLATTHAEVESSKLFRDQFKCGGVLSPWFLVNISLHRNSGFPTLCWASQHVQDKWGIEPAPFWRCWYTVQDEQRWRSEAGAQIS